MTQEPWASSGELDVGDGCTFKWSTIMDPKSPMIWSVYGDSQEAVHRFALMMDEWLFRDAGRFEGTTPIRDLKAKLRDRGWEHMSNVNYSEETFARVEEFVRLMGGEK